MTHAATVVKLVSFKTDVSTGATLRHSKVPGFDNHTAKLPSSDTCSHVCTCATDRLVERKRWRGKKKNERRKRDGEAYTYVLTALVTEGPPS